MHEEEFHLICILLDASLVLQKLAKVGVTCLYVRVLRAVQELLFPGRNISCNIFWWLQHITISTCVFPHFTSCWSPLSQVSENFKNIVNCSVICSEFVQLYANEYKKPLMCTLDALWNPEIVLKILENHHSVHYFRGIKVLKSIWCKWKYKENETVFPNMTTCLLFYLLSWIPVQLSLICIY